YVELDRGESSGQIDRPVWRRCSRSDAAGVVENENFSIELARVEAIVCGVQKERSQAKGEIESPAWRQRGGRCISCASVAEGDNIRRSVQRQSYVENVVSGVDSDAECGHNRARTEVRCDRSVGLGDEAIESARAVVHVYFSGRVHCVKDVVGGIERQAQKIDYRGKAAPLAHVSKNTARVRYVAVRGTDVVENRNTGLSCHE